MIYQVSHTTSYNYEHGVSFCHNIATLKPKNVLGQTLLEYELQITPNPDELSEKIDFFGNTITRFSIQKQHTELKVKAISKVQRNCNEIPNIYNDIEAQNITLEKTLKILDTTSSDILEAKQFCLESVLIANISPEIKAYAQVSLQPNRSVFQASFELMQRIF